MTIINIPTTQRAYTLRLRGLPGDESWREHLWQTHQAVNRGAQVFGDWLLTLRGGLSHTLVDEPVKDKKTEGGKRPPMADEIRDRRIVLALSWLSVESDPPRHAITLDPKAVMATFEALLRSKQITDSAIVEWMHDCSPSLNAAIRDGAVWVNRAAMFVTAQQRVGDSLTSDEVWDLLERFFGSRDAYFVGIVSPKSGDEDPESDDQDEAKKEAKELSIEALGWLCDRVGDGPGADYARLSHNYLRISQECSRQIGTTSGPVAISTLLQSLPDLKPSTLDLAGLLKIVGATGHKSTTRKRLQQLFQANMVFESDWKELADLAQRDANKTAEEIGRKGQRDWATAVVIDVKESTHMAYKPSESSRALQYEFAVILGHAARRVCQTHSWIKLAETSRRQFEADAHRIGNVPEEAKRWLDAYCAERSGETGALEEYRIRKSAIGGWKEIVQRWQRATCQTREDRIEAAREVQADPDLKKFGDIQLFETLAGDDARCVWRVKDEPTTKPLEDYVAATDAAAKRLRFKVPAYRHPDALRHPVFCDFGNSQWSIEFAVHQRHGELPKKLEAITRADENVTKALAALDKAKTPEKQQAAQQKLEDARKKLDAARCKTAWLQSNRGLRMGLWNGQCLSDTELNWSSKRLAADLAIQQIANTDGALVEVGRADRLGRAAAGTNSKHAVAIAGLFDLDHWNGRLQAPRRQLDDIADIRDGKKGKWKDQPQPVRDAEVRKRIAKINWLVSFSAKLQPHGPWIDFAPTRGLNPDPVYFPHAAENKKRKSRGRRMLSHIPGLRILSVDLGHRFAAACAVWETMTSEQVAQMCREAGVPAPGSEATYWLVPRPENKGQIVFRRIGADLMPNGKEKHPAPWARLERQFLVKLAGEDEPARWPTADELAAVEDFEQAVGLVREKEEKESGDKSPHSKLRIDEFMANAVRTARLALRRHGDYARIATGLKGDVRTLPGGRPMPINREELSEHLARVVGYWHGLATGDRWNDSFAKATWTELLREVGWNEPVAALSRETGKKQKEEIEQQFAQIASRLSPEQRAAWVAKWSAEWTRRDGAWNVHLRWLRGWIMGRGGKKRARHTLRNVGGLSLQRIDTMKSLYQVQKAFFTRMKLDGTKETAKEGFGRRTLQAMERLRENRVKQLSSRIVEAALGVGNETHRPDHRDAARPRERVFAPCHAVVIENLRNYKPDELQTRRENRQLMSWSAGQVRKYLSEGCQLHGLHLREVSPSYTSRQDFRTGAPGMRCVDVSVAEFLREGSYWQTQVKKVRDEKEKDRNAWQRYLLAMHDQWSAKPEGDRKDRFVRIPKKGGELFVPAQLPIDARGDKRHLKGPPGIQADLNAAANIGLRALLDPDWAGAWWYIPAAQNTERRCTPNPETTVGAAALEGWSWQPDAPVDAAGGDSKNKREKKAKKEKEFVNVWQFPQPQLVPLATATWYHTTHYWALVQCWVTDVLQGREPEVLKSGDPETPF